MALAIVKHERDGLIPPGSFLPDSNSTMLVIARTDAESGKPISSMVDVAGHEFVEATTVPGKPLAELIAEAEGRGKRGRRLMGLRGSGRGASVAVEAAIKESTIEDKEGAFKTFKDATVGKSISDMREIAKDILGASVFWDYEMPRTREGYYHVPGGLGPAIKRATTFASYADLVWLETKTPDIEEARYFARKIRETYPETGFVYNLSPIFNWSAHGFSETNLKNFCWELGKEGFVLQLISLAGLHSNATATAELAARYKEDGMLAYVQLVQRKEKEIGCDVLTHQKWSGANYIDKILQSVSSGSSSTSAVGKDSTENSF
ncbi:mitochondrial 2-methylisocitrate lyase [Marasmius tenuissimus]|uniref:methylisocitrate lyase n=1 Tax=Marasmius tenuissimus TaxID=585030 RepID=A0ABR3A691_9AGAR